MATTANEDSSKANEQSNNSSNSSGNSKADNQEKIKLRQLATKAKGFFDNGKFDDCITVLKSIVEILIEKGEGGLKVSHNIALCEYYQRFDNIQHKNSSAHFFLKELSKLKKEAAKESLSDLSTTTSNGNGNGDEMLTDQKNSVENQHISKDGESSSSESNSNSDSASKDGSKESGNVSGNGNIAAGEIDEDEFAGDPLMSILMLNQATVLIKMKRTLLALKTLETLFSNIMLLEEPLALKTCTLLLEVYINLFRGNQNINGGMTEMQANAAKVIDYLEKHADEMAEANNGNSNGNSNDTSNNSNNNINAQENGESGGNNDSKSKADLSPISIVFNFKLRLYKAQFELIRWNVSKAKKEVKSALEIYQKQLKDLPPGSIGEDPLPDNTTGLFLKANLEYLRANYKKSIKLLNSCSDVNEQASALYLNNMGCIHFSTGRYRTAALYFSKALSAGADLSASSDIVYNAGIQLLLSGEDINLAFQCFIEAAKYQKDRPHLWLRIAECCMIENEKRQNQVQNEAFVTSSHDVTVRDEEHLSRFKNDLVDSVVGDDKNGSRRILLPKNYKTNLSGIPARGEDGEMSMEFAIACLKSVLFLTKKTNSSSAASSNSTGDTNTATTNNRFNTGPDDAFADDDDNEESKKRLSILRQSALVGLSYCGLVIRHPMLALKSAEELLSSSTPCSAAHKLLGRTYAAEALCMMNRPEEALDHVTEAFKKDASEGQENDGIFRSTNSDLPSTIAENPFSAQARAALCVNVAAVRLQMGDLEDAETALNRALALNPSCPEILKSFLYLRLKQGNHHDASLLLKQRRPNPV
jgi:CCR4-NOT transcription complex subunit 10